MKSIQIVHLFYSIGPFLLFYGIYTSDFTKLPLSEDREMRKTRSVWEQRSGTKAAIPTASTLKFHPLTQLHHSVCPHLFHWYHPAPVVSQCLSECLALSPILCVSLCFPFSQCLSLSVSLSLLVFLSMSLSQCLSVSLSVCVSLSRCLSLPRPPLGSCKNKVKVWQIFTKELQRKQTKTRKHKGRDWCVYYRDDSHSMVTEA